jgi:hypothetical protein
VKAWHKLDPDPALRATVLAALGIQRQSSDWTKENGRYIPNASTWLNGRRWEDEVSSPGDPLPFRPRAVAQPAPTYPEDDWCAHEPRCNSREWHAVIIAEESGA